MPIPAYWEPCPGNMNAVFFRTFIFSSRSFFFAFSLAEGLEQ